MHSRRDNGRHIAAPTGTALSCKSWATEAAMRMLMNNLDPRVAEAPEELVVYGGIGRAARDWESYDAIVATLKRLDRIGLHIFYAMRPGLYWAPGALNGRGDSPDLAVHWAITAVDSAGVGSSFTGRGAFPGRRAESETRRSSASSA